MRPHPAMLFAILFLVSIGVALESASAQEPLRECTTRFGNQTVVRHGKITEALCRQATIVTATPSPTQTPPPTPTIEPTPTPTPPPTENVVFISAAEGVGWSRVPMSDTVYECVPRANPDGTFSMGVLDGQRSIQQAFRNPQATPSHNVTIRNCVIQNYATADQRCAVDGRWGTGWRIENNYVQHNRACGIEIGSFSLATSNFVLYNGQTGVKADDSTDAVYHNNEIAFNNCGWNGTTDPLCTWPGINPGFEAGGSKFARTIGLDILGNWVHHNKGPGLWTDIDNIDTLYDGNTVEDNCQMGIFHEVSYRAVIRNNVVQRNSHDVGCNTASPDWGYGAQILIAHSPNVEVFGNQVRSSCSGCDGIVVIQQQRGSGAYGPHEARDNWIHHNEIWFEQTGNQGWAAGATADYSGGLAIAQDNSFDFNTYHLPNLTCGCFDFSFQTLNWDGWRSHGQDVNGIAQ